MANIEVSLSFSLFPRRSPDEFWLTVQPWVALEDLARPQLKSGWLDILTGDGSASLSYSILFDKLTRLGAEPDAFLQNHVPVPLTKDVSLTVQLLDTAGVIGTWTNHRNGLVVPQEQAENFAKDNIRSSNRKADQPAKPNNSNGWGPYAAIVHDHLAALYRQGQDEGAVDRISQLLAMSFLGGTTRRFRPSTVTNTGAVHLFKISPAIPLPDTVPEPNRNSDAIYSVSHVSAVGLMVRLDEVLNQGKGLRDIAGINVFVHPHDVVAPTTTKIVSTEENQLLARYFADFVFANLPAPCDPKTVYLTSEQPLGQRVYVSQHLTPLAPYKLKPSTLLFRKPSSGPTARRAEQPLTLGQIARIVLRVGDQNLRPPPPAPVTIEFRELLDVQLVPYRASGVTSANPGGNCLMQLVPPLSARDRFLSYFAELKATVGSWPDDAALFKADGSPLDGNLKDTFVGVYYFAWDDVKSYQLDDGKASETSLPTVLFWMPPPSVADARSLTLVHKVVTSDPVTAVARGFTAREPLGPRWEWRKTDSPILPSDKRFDALVVTGLNVTADVKIAIALADDNVFSFAQSISNVEGVIQVRYPAQPPDQAATPQDMDPLTQYQLSLANYNKLDVSYTVVDHWPPPPVVGARLQASPLNFYSEALAVFNQPLSDANGATHTCTFHYRYQTSAYAQQLSNDLKPKDEADLAPVFFAKSYKNAGKFRAIWYDLQHVTGDAFPLFGVAATNADIPFNGGRMVHDQPPTIAADFRHLGKTQRQTPFLSWKFGANKTSAIFEINQEFLLPSDAALTNGVTPGTPTNAWRALADAVFGTSRIRGRFRRFDFLTAIRARDASGVVHPSDGLIPVGDYEQQVWTLNMATPLSWFTSGNPTAGTTLSVDFAKPDPPPGAAPNLPLIESSCHVVELWHEVVRRDETVPGAPESYSLVRPITDATFSNSGTLVGSVFDANGQKCEPCPDAMPSFKRAVANIVSGWGTIRPVDTTLSPLLHLLRGEEDASVPGGSAGGEWLLAGAPAAGAEPITAVLLPMAFRNFGSSAAAGVSASLSGMERYAEALGLLLDAAHGAWSKDKTSVIIWQKWFGDLENNQPGILAVMKAMQATLEAAYSETTASLPLAVKKLVTLVQTRAPNPADSVGWLRKKMWQSVVADPALFGTTRALLLTQLVATSALPSDFMRLDTTRKLGPQGSSTGQESTRLGLTETVVGGVTANSLAFLETLGNAKYDDVFEVSSLEAYGLTQLASTAPKPFTLNKQLPGGGDLVYLPSRQILVRPIHLFTGTFPAFADADWWKRYDNSEELVSQTGLLQSRALKPPDDYNDVALRLIAKTTNTINNATELDRGRLMAAFFITSDESNEFVNDLFPIVMSGALPSDSDVRPASGDEVTPNGNSREQPIDSDLRPPLFKDLDGVTVLSEIPSLHSALDPDTLKFVTETLGQAPAVVVPQAPQWLQVHVGRRELTFRQDPTQESSTAAPAMPDVTSLQGFLFGPKTMPPSGPATYVLLITYECDVWSAHTIGVGQTRNISGASNQPLFAKSFWQAAPIIAVQTPVFARGGVADKPLAPVTIPRQGMETLRLLQLVLIEQNLLQKETSPPSRWLFKNLALTIHGRLQTQMNFVQIDASSSWQQMLDHGKLPLRLVEVAVSHSAPARGVAVDFDPAFNSYLMDFLWTDEHNNELLRIADIPVNIA